MIRELRGDKGIKPIAIITMSPDSNITDQTEIVWSYSASYDPSGLEIVDAEWQNKQTIYPEGKHVVWLRVQNAINIWSDWVRITFTAVSAQPPEASEERVPIRTIKNVSVVGGSKVGGLVGESTNSSIINSCVIGSVGGNGKVVGALVGESNSSAIINSCAEGKAKGEKNVVGGLLGLSSQSSIENSYAITDVVGESNFVGGFIGRSVHSTIVNTFSAGNVIGHNHTGGLIGQCVNSKIINSYYDKDISGQIDTDKCESKTTTELKQKIFFVDWDFKNTWQINEGETYPYLR